MIRTVAFAARLIVGLLLAVTSLAESGEIQYLTLLEPPVAGDRIGYPRGVTVDLHTGEIFVCDTRKNRVLIFDTDTLFDYQIPGGTSFSAPIDVAVDPDGYLLLIANHQIRRTIVKLDFDGLFMGELELHGLPPGMASPSLSSVALSPTGDRIYLVDTTNLHLWIADRNGQIIRGVDLAEKLSEKERRDVILGKVDVYGDQVVLAISNLGRVQVYDLELNFKGIYGEKGTTPCKIAFPTAAALDDQGRLLVLDQQRMVIVRWDTKGNRCVDEHYSIGNLPGYLYYPFDITLDGSGRIFTSQGFQGRVQAYEGSPPAAGGKQQELGGKQPAP